MIKNGSLWFLTALVILLLVAIMPGSAESVYYLDQSTCFDGTCAQTGIYQPGYYQDPYGQTGYYESNSASADYRRGYYPYRTNRQQGYLSAGQYRIYNYRIGGYRSYIEWILKGNYGSDFDLYVFQNRNACSPCRADRYDTSGSSNAYVGWSNPSSGSYFSVVVYCRSGSGYFDLTCNSYTGRYYGSIEMSAMSDSSSGSSDTFVTSNGQVDASQITWVNEDSSSYSETFPSTDPGYYTDPNQGYYNPGPYQQYQPWG
jgi:hypothetical protein